MKQKITIEIENDTGLEFEDTTKWDCPKEGEYFINSRHKIEKSDRFSSCYHYVLTPKIDAELEEAKRLVGKYVKYKSGDPTLFLVDEVSRSFNGQLIVFFKNSSSSVFYKYCIPFPIPVWRCCESDRPKTQGRYYTRRKRDHAERDLDEYCGENWEAINPEYISPLDYEWLDEGGE